MNKLKIILMRSLLFVVYFSCKKMDLNTSNVMAIDLADIKASKDWIIQKETMSNGKATIDSLANSLDWASSSKISFGTNESLIVIPIALNLAYNHSAEINKAMKMQTGSACSHALVLIKDRGGNIRKGNIVEISGNYQLNHIIQLIQNVYYDKPTSFTGNFVLMTINKDFIYRLNYLDGKKQSYNSRISASNLKSSRSNAVKSLGGKNKATFSFNAIECTDWYWTTTVYDANDNIISYSEQYLYTTCPSGGGSGGSGGDGSTSTDYNNFTLDRIPIHLKHHV